MSDEDIQHKQNLINLYKRRLHDLEEKQALYGYDTPPQVKMEIEDIRKSITELISQIEGYNQARNILQPTDRLRTSDRNIRPLPIFILLDASGSMAGQRIELMREGIVRLIDFLQWPNEPIDPILSILTFGNQVELLIPPSTISSIREIPYISAGGATALGGALSFLAQILRTQSMLPPRILRPLIIVTLDGSPTDDWQAGLADLESTLLGARADRLVLAIGDGADYRTLRKIGNLGVLPLIQPEDMLQVTNFFKWVSTAVISTRADESVRELPSLPADISDVWYHDDEDPRDRAAEIVSRENKLIEDMSHHLVWHHHDSRDAKGSTWSAIASEAGRFNYDYKFLVHFLKLKNKNNGWQIPGTAYTPAPIPSIQDFIEILEIRLNHIKQVIDTGNLALKWSWPPTWGYVPWNGPVVHTNTIRKLPDDYYLEIANREYVQTETAIKQYKLLLG